MLLIATTLLAVVLCGSAAGQDLPRVDNEVKLDLIKLPPGFSIEVYASQPVPSARMLTVSSGGSQQYPNAVIAYVGSISFNYTQETEEDVGNGRVSCLICKSWQRLRALTLRIQTSAAISNFCRAFCRPLPSFAQHDHVGPS